MKPIRIELPTGLAVGPVNAYLFTEPEPVLVDTGLKSEASWATLQSGLAAQGVSVADLAKVIITHPHVDHVGQAGMLTAQSNAEVWIAEVGLPWILDFEAMWEKRLTFYREMMLPRLGLSSEAADALLGYMTHVATLCDSVPAERVRAFGVDATLEMGGSPWQVLHTPGHASTQTCFYQSESRQMLSADMLLEKAPMPIVERPPDGSERVPALPQFLESLTLVEALDLSDVFPGHGMPFANHRALVRQQRERIQMRKAECQGLVESGHRTVFQLANIMYEDYPPQFRFAGMWMLVGYLDLLKAEGLVEEREESGVWHYYQTGGSLPQVGVDTGAASR